MKEGGEDDETKYIAKTTYGNTQRIRLPNGQFFLARNERVSRRNLTRNVTIKRTRTIAPRRQSKRWAQIGGSILVQIAKLEGKFGTETLLKKKRKHPFVIADTDSSSKEETHWWSILDIEPKTGILFIDSFGLDGLKAFIIRTINKNCIWD